jgi:hypothetical protein
MPVMQKPCRLGSAQEYVLAAIEAGSGALRAVEAARALSAREEDEGLRLGSALARALAHVRAALAELRSLEGSSPASAGFVLPTESDPDQRPSRADAADSRAASRPTYAHRPRAAG